MLGSLSALHRRPAARTGHHRKRSERRVETPSGSRQAGASAEELRGSRRVRGQRADRLDLARAALRLLAHRQLARDTTRGRRAGVGHSVHHCPEGSSRGGRRGRHDPRGGRLRGKARRARSRGPPARRRQTRARRLRVLRHRAMFKKPIPQDHVGHAQRPRLDATRHYAFDMRIIAGTSSASPKRSKPAH